MRENIASFRKGWDIFHSFRWHFLVLVGLTLLNQLVWQIAPFLFGQFINNMQEGGPMSRTVTLIGFSFLSWNAGLLIARWRGLYQEKHVEYQIEQHLASMTLEKYLGLSLGQHRSQSSGITQSVVSKGRGALQQMAFLVLYTILPLTTGILVTMVALTWFDWRAGTIIATSIILFTWQATKLNRKYYPSVRRYNDTGDEINKHFGELLRNVSVVQLNSQEERVHGEHSERLEKWGDQGLEVWIPYIKASIPKHAFIFVARAGIYFLGAYSFYQENAKLGDIVIMINWANQATNDLWQIAPVQRQWLDLWSKVKKYFAVLDVVPAVQIVPNPVPADRLEGKVEFKNVSYTYSDQRYVIDEKKEKASSKPNLPALQDVSFVIRPGERVAFVGRSGAGKSTLLFLLTRGDDPNKGQILVDGNDLRLIDLNAYRHALGLVEQNVLLFDHTIRYNMLFGLNGGAQSVTDAELEELAKISRIDSFRDRLTDGWETRIGENGVRLSGGERQRVSIARALAKESRLLLLDEATSNLDGENERFIKEAIRNASVGRTTIIIAHRLSTVRDADRIYVMDKGSIVDGGRHDELVETSPIYRKLVHDQLVSL